MPMTTNTADDINIYIMYRKQAKYIQRTKIDNLQRTDCTGPV